jgi:hypothetical protein
MMNHRDVALFRTTPLEHVAVPVADIAFRRTAGDDGASGEDLIGEC